MYLNIIGRQESSEGLAGDHLPGIGNLLTFRGKVRREPKDVHLAPHR